MKCPQCNGTGQVASGNEMMKLRGKLKQKDVAKRMKIAASYLSDLEKGRRSWNAELERKYRKAVDELSSL